MEGNGQRTIIQHLTDWSVSGVTDYLICQKMVYTIPPGSYHNLMADHANADDLSIDQLLDELRSADGDERDVQ